MIYILIVNCSFSVFPREGKLDIIPGSVERTIGKFVRPKKISFLSEKKKRKSV